MDTVLDLGAIPPNGVGLVPQGGPPGTQGVVVVAVVTVQQNPRVLQTNFKLCILLVLTPFGTFT